MSTFYNFKFLGLDLMNSVTFLYFVRITVDVLVIIYIFVIICSIILCYSFVICPLWIVYINSIIFSFSYKISLEFLKLEEQTKIITNTKQIVYYDKLISIWNKSLPIFMIIANKY